jgi:xanthine/uracil permease
MKALTLLFNWMTKNGPFILTFISLVGVIVMAIFKNGDLSLLATLLGLYLGSTASRAVSSHWAASKDALADTAAVISDVEGTKRDP